MLIIRQTTRAATFWTRAAGLVPYSSQILASHSLHDYMLRSLVLTSMQLEKQ